MEKELSLDLWRSLLRIRLVEEAIIARYAEQKMRCPVHLSIGQEAVAVGVCKAALHSDYVLGNHRSHAHYLAKGGNLQRMLAEIYGKQTGCCQGRGGSMHLSDLSANFIASTPIVGGTIPVAVGVAFSQVLQQKESGVIVFLGEGATEEGVWSESLNFAALKNLPIAFVCENNFYSVYSPLSVRQSDRRDRAKIAQAQGVKAFPVEEGNDVEKVYAQTKLALQQMREERVPVYLEFTTYRTKEHCGMAEDDHLGYRPLEQVAHFQKKCPLALQTKRLKNQGYLQEENQKRDSIIAEIEEAFLEAEKAPYPIFSQEEALC